MIEIRNLNASDENLVMAADPDIFDSPLRSDWVAEFLADPRHHLAVAVDGLRVVGFGSAVHYVHPDKPPELWINEVGVSEDYRRQGLGSRLVRSLMEVGRSLGCVEAWVLTERSNRPAVQLYESLGATEAPEETVMFSFPLDGKT